MRISDWSSDVCSSDLTYLGSDALALASLTQRVIYLEEGDWVVCGHDKIQIYDQANQRVERAITQSGVDGEMISKGNHRHYMIKEIYETPIVREDGRSVRNKYVSTCRSRWQPCP